MPVTHTIDRDASCWRRCPACGHKYPTAQFRRINGVLACRFCCPPPRLAPAVVFNDRQYSHWYKRYPVGSPVPLPGVNA